MLAGTFLERLFEFAHQFALGFVELDRGLDQDVAVQVARVAGTYALDALAAQPELLGSLRAFRDIDHGLAGQCRHIDLAAQ